jgi:hypothetical protein
MTFALTFELATEQLYNYNFDPAFTHLIFSYISNNDIPIENRLSAALFFKNYVGKYWVTDEKDAASQEKAFGQEVMAYIKDNFAKLLMLNPRKIGENLVDIANVIGKAQLNVEWPNFLPVISLIDFIRKFFRDFRMYLKIHILSYCRL